MKEGSARASGLHQTKAQATAAAKKIARRDVVEIVIHSRSGRLINSKMANAPLPPRDSNASLNSLMKPTLAPSDKARLWREWAASHPRNSRVMDDSAINRETIYGERG